MGFPHERPGEEAGGGGQDRGHPDRRIQAGEGGGHAADQGADGIAGVAPQPVDAQGERARQAGWVASLTAASRVG